MYQFFAKILLNVEYNNDLLFEHPYGPIVMMIQNR